MLPSKSGNGARILVVEDEANLREATVAYLQLEGFIPVGVGTLGAAQLLLEVQDFDLLVLDLGLPDGDARVWLEQRVVQKEQGVIVTTARGERSERVAGAQAGADCYLVKPVDLDELVAMARNLLRRLRPDAPSDWTLDVLKWTLRSPEAKMFKLTHSELVILVALATRVGESVSRDELALALGHDPLAYDPRRLEVLVRRLRNKLTEHLGYPPPLETVHGQGYAFTAPIAVIGA